MHARSERTHKLLKGKLVWSILVTIVACQASIQPAWCGWWGIQAIPLEELKAKYANSHSAFVNAGGMQVHIRDEGQGPVIVLLHGVLASLNTWEGWTPELTKHYRVISMDLPGFGLTGDMPGDTYDPDRVLEIVREVVLKRGVTKATFIGNSFGGYLSWKMASVHPELVERLVIIDGRSFPQKWPWLLKLLTFPVVRHLAPYIAPRPTVMIGVYQVYGDNSRVTSKTISRYHDLLLRPGNRAAMIKVFTWLKVTEKPFYSTPDPDLLKLKQPLMTIWGRKDAWIPYDPIGIQWEKAYPQARHVVYDDAGHIPMEEIPGRTVKDVLTFLCDTDAGLGYTCRR